MRIRRVLSLVVFLFRVTPSGTRATSLRVVNLEDLVLHSETIFQGRCVNVLSGLDSKGLPYTQYGFRVIERFRGAPGDLVTVKQFGYSARPGPGRGTGNVARIDGMPEYLPEQTYLIFLGPRSPLGFSAPVGLYQGAFLINDAKQAVNALGNRNLTFDGSGGAAVSSASAGDSDLVRGPVSYPRLKALIQQLVLGEEISLSSMASQLKGVDR